MTQLRNVISKERLDAYKQSPNDSELDCLKRYVWNIALSEALYPSIQYLEVGLRNSIHEAARSNFNNDFWFDDHYLIRDSRTQSIIQKAKQSLTRAGKPLDAGRIIAELHFGFWRTLFFNEYEIRLWRPIIKDVFPNAPRKERQRTSLGSRVHQVKELRNRVFHHEPIWHWTDLEKQHEDILKTIQWMNQPLYDLAVLNDRFQQVYTMDLNTNEKALKKLKI